MSDAQRHAEGAQERFYVGRRAALTEVYAVTLRDVVRLHPRPGAGLAFSWGHEARPDGVELAFAILGHVIRREPSDQLCARFQWDVLASLPSAGFVFGCDDVVRWLAAEQRGLPTEWPAVEPGPRPRRRLVDAPARAVQRLRALGAGRTSAAPIRLDSPAGGVGRAGS